MREYYTVHMSKRQQYRSGRARGKIGRHCAFLLYCCTCTPASQGTLCKYPCSYYRSITKCSRNACIGQRGSRKLPKDAQNLLHEAQAQANARIVNTNYNYSSNTRYPREYSTSSNCGTRHEYVFIDTFRIVRCCTKERAVLGNQNLKILQVRTYHITRMMCDTWYDIYIYWYLGYIDVGWYL